MIAVSFLVSIVISSSFAKEECTVDTVTDHCSQFSATAPERVEFPDGTYITNLLASSKRDKPDGEAGVAGLQTQADLDKQVRLAQLLETIPASRMSERFKQFLLSRPETVSSVFLTDPIIDSVSLVWPANDESATVKKVPLADVKRSGLFTATEIAQLRSIAGEANVIRAGAPIPLLAGTTQAEAARVKRLSELIQFSRDSIITIVQKGRPLSALTPEERATIDKISSIQFLDPQSMEVRTQPPCKSELGNAFYQPDKHVFTICPSMLHYPDSLIVAVIAHEFSHAIDSCRSQGTLYEIHRDKITVTDPASATPGMKKLLQRWRQRDPKFPLFNVSGNEMVDMGTMPGDLAQLQQLGIISVKAPGVPFAKYPFADAYRCLTTGQRAFASVRDSDIKKFADEVMRLKRQAGESADRTKMERELIRQILSQNKQCWSTAANDEMSEVMPDWVAAQVEGRFLERNPVRNARERLAPASFFSLGACMQRDREATERGKETTAAAVVRRAAQSFHHRDTHASSLRRYDDIYLAEPRTRRALGCAGSNRSSCFDTRTGSVRSSGASGGSGAAGANR